MPGRSDASGISPRLSSIPVQTVSAKRLTCPRGQGSRWAPSFLDPHPPDTYLLCVRTSPTKKRCRRLTLYQSARHARLRAALDKSRDQRRESLERIVLLRLKESQQPNNGGCYEAHRRHKAKHVDEDRKKRCVARTFSGGLAHACSLQLAATVPCFSGFPSTRAISRRRSRPCSLRPRRKLPAGKSGLRRRRRRRLLRPRCTSRGS